MTAPKNRMRIQGPWSGGPLITRIAGPDDRDLILSIDARGGAYDEADYLPAKLDMYLRDPNRICYIGEIDGKPVTFFLGRTLDDGKLICGRLARVDRAWRRTGAWNIFRFQTIDDWQTKRYPQTRTYIGDMSNYREVFKPSVKATNTFLGFNLNIVRAKAVFTCPSDMEAPRAPGKALYNQGIVTKEMSEAECKDLLLKREKIFRLFPHSIAIVSREPVPICSSDVKKITEECTSIYYSYNNEQTEYTTISFGTPYSAPQGNIYELDINTVAVDKDQLLQHVENHVDRAKKHFSGQAVKVIIFLYPYQAYEMLRTGLAACGFSMPDVAVEYSTASHNNTFYHNYLKSKI